jgi:hypothetical protein
MTEKNAINSSFRVDQTVKIKGYDFLMPYHALDGALYGLDSVVLPKIYKYVDKDSEPVDNPTKEQIESGEVRRVFDPYETFRRKNVQEAFVLKVNDLTNPQAIDEELFRISQILEAKRVMMEVLDREARAGNTVLIEDLMEEQRKAEEFKTEVVNEQ